jgi:hypothetical protein
MEVHKLAGLLPVRKEELVISGKCGSGLTIVVWWNGDILGEETVEEEDEVGRSGVDELKISCMDKESVEKQWS